MLFLAVDYAQAMEIVKSGLKATLGSLPSLVLLQAKCSPDSYSSQLVTTYLGFEHMVSYIRYSPDYKTQFAMIGISFFLHGWLFYKQTKLFEDPAAYDRQLLEPWFIFSSASIQKTVGAKSAKKFEDILQYYRQGLIKMGLFEFLGIWALSCVVLACQRKLNFKSVKYSVLCTLIDVGPSLIYLLWQKPVQNKMQTIDP
jgi:hypothetical protein